MKFKVLILLAVFTAFSSSFIACNKDNKTEDDKNITQLNNIPQNSNSKVYPLISNSQANGKIAADFEWYQNGTKVKFSEFTKGKFVLLNFWGTWCPPCRAELPDLVQIAKEMESKNLVVLGVALERTDNMDEAVKIVSEFWNKNKLYYPVVIGTQSLTMAYGGIPAVPTTFLIKDNGEIFTMFEGGRSKESFMQEINRMMGK